MKSIDNFDISQNVRFSTYAVPMIIGEIRRYLRDNNAIRVSRSMRDTAYKAMQVEGAADRRKQRRSRQWSRSQRRWACTAGGRGARAGIHRGAAFSLYEPVYSDGGRHHLRDGSGRRSQTTTATGWMKSPSRRRSAGLGSREKRIFTLRFFKGKTQMEVAEEIGISPGAGQPA